MFAKLDKILNILKIIKILNEFFNQKSNELMILLHLLFAFNKVYIYSIKKPSYEIMMNLQNEVFLSKISIFMIIFYQY